MAIQSLQKIILLENELYQAEQLEQEKLSAWITDQQAEIERNYQSRRDDLKRKNEQFRDKIETDANIKAHTIFNKAKDKAAYLDTIDEEFLKSNLSIILPYITGQGS